MNYNRAFTYSFLAYIHETNENFNDFSDIFIPLVKRVLSELYSNEISKGTLIFLKESIDEKYGLDMPYPMVKNITQKIATEYNNDNIINFQAFESDGSFIMQNYIFADYEEEISAREHEINLIQASFEKDLQTKGIEIENVPSIYHFLEKNKHSLSTFFAHKEYEIRTEEVEAIELLQVDFLRSVKNTPNIFNPLKRIYLGSIIASYLEMRLENLPNKIEFVLDTNFIISLINLNSIESYHTCKKIVEICTQMGHKLTVLQNTIEETKNLLIRNAENYETSFLAKKIDEESIYSACDRNKYSRTDLERIAHSFHEELNDKIEIIDAIDTIEKYQNRAKYSKEYEILKEREISLNKTGDKGALHDATVIEYVKSKRGNKLVAKFEDVNCWFVNSRSDMPYLRRLQNGNQSNIIKAEDLVNRLWLSNPSVIPSNEIAELGLSRLISGTISNATPSAKALKKLDEKFQKYVKQNNISDKDCARVAMALSEKTIKNLRLVDELSQTNDDSLFAEKLNFVTKEYEKQDQIEKENRQQIIEEFEELKIEMDKKLTEHAEESQKRSKEQHANYEKNLKRQEKEFKKKSEEGLFQKEQENYKNLTKAYRIAKKNKEYIKKEVKKNITETYILIAALFLIPFFIGFFVHIYFFATLLFFAMYVFYLTQKYGTFIFTKKNKQNILEKLFIKKDFDLQGFKDLENEITKSKNVIDGIPTVLVEGKSDEIIVNEVVKLFAPNLHTFVAVRCGLDDTGGTTWLKNETIRFIEQGNTMIFSIFDDDNAGKQSCNEVCEKLKDKSNHKIKVERGYSAKPRHITNWLQKSIKIPITLEEMYSESIWHKAEDMGFLEYRDANEITSICEQYKDWDKSKQNVSQLLELLKSNDSFIFLEKKVKDSSKVSFANYIIKLDESEKNEALKDFRKLAEEIQTFFNKE